MIDLDDRLEARVRRLTSHAPGRGPVMYWMRTAARAHENPALEVALLAGRALGAPVFVYHALSERYPYASDRHHTFVLEGARDVRDRLAERGVASVFHLERPEHRGPWLRQLAERAALVVTEEMPVDPLRRWTRALADAIAVPVWAVDTATVVPMRLVGRGVDRAFVYRERVEPHLDAFLEPTEPVEVERSELPDLPFAPTELDADLAELVAACAIDHTVPPVRDTPGGTTAGIARWRAFVDRGGLDAYPRTRNDAAYDGVSRMSAYLHYGMVAPTEIAREAGARGADKYLDELIVWRELAYTWCLYARHHDTLDALPAWARATLLAHADDPRPLRPSLDQLHRGTTGVPLWDLAQRSLLRFGELHNNVRMTWGKALLAWSDHPQQALDRLIDLNHRYALDGRDPASYGGLLWCLGLFDRPFPEQPVWGTVRSRSVAQHAKRLDLSRYGARMIRPRDLSVLVIGAGLAGAMAARTLADHGVRVRVVDKARGAGGRTASKRLPEGTYRIGADVLHLSDPRLARYVEAWVDAGFLAPAGEGAWRAEPSNGLVKALLDGIEVRYSHRAAAVRGPTVTFEDGSEERADVVIVAVPAPQAGDLLGEGPLADALRAVPYSTEVVEYGPGLTHRWRYCRCLAPLDGELRADGPVIVAGDCFAGGDANGALLSGAAAAGRVLSA